MILTKISRNNDRNMRFYKQQNIPATMEEGPHPLVLGPQGWGLADRN
jgi:hypothetical protein